MATSVVHGLAGPKVKGNFLQKGWPPVRDPGCSFLLPPPGFGPGAGRQRQAVPPPLLTLPRGFILSSPGLVVLQPVMTERESGKNS